MTALWNAWCAMWRDVAVQRAGGCGSCYRLPLHSDAFIGMQPGRDDVPWALCRTCWAPAKPAIGRPASTRSKPARAIPSPGGLL